MVKNPILRAKNIYKSYPQGASELQILRGLSLEIYPGDAVSILGSSGAGKSTFLQILGTLDRPQSGELFFDNKDLLKMDDEELSQFRNQKMGFVFQFHHLINEFTALENIMLPSRIANETFKESKLKAEEMLSILGMKDRMNHYPSQLSGGELQRVAIGRSLICRPQILFADEPTGNLDSRNGALIQDLFFDLKSRMGLSLVVVTHDLNFAARFPKVLRMKDGNWTY